MLGCDRAGEAGSLLRERMAIPFFFAEVLVASWAIPRSSGAGESPFCFAGVLVASWAISRSFGAGESFFCFAGALGASWAISRSFGAGASFFAASQRKQNPPQSSECTEESV